MADERSRPPLDWRQAFLYHPFRQIGLLVGLIRGTGWRLWGSSDGWPVVHAGVVCRCQHGSIQLGHFTRLAARVCVEAVGECADKPARVSIGDYTRVGSRTLIYARRGVTIGSRCAISWNCTIADCGMPEAAVDADDRVTQAAPITMGDHVWIGCNVRILKGVTIGDGAVIGTGSVVINDIPPRTLAVGIPARPIRNVACWK